MIDLVLISIKLWSSPPLPFKFSDKTTALLPLMKSDLRLIQSTLQKYYLGFNGAIPLSGFVRRIRDALPFTCNYYDIYEIALPSFILGRGRAGNGGEGGTIELVFNERVLLHSFVLKERRLSQSPLNSLSGREVERKSSSERFTSVKQFLASNSY